MNLHSRNYVRHYFAKNIYIYKTMSSILKSFELCLLLSENINIKALIWS